MSHSLGDSSRARPPVPPFHNALDKMASRENPGYAPRTKMGIADAVFAPSLQDSRRDVLSPLRQNLQPASSRSLIKPRTVIRHPIPRPALVPDVFAVDTTPPSLNTSKRSLDSTSLPAPKRSKLDKPDRADKDKSLLEVCTGRHKAEEERWKSKWVKAFPTLVFHFEIGSETSQRKALIARVNSMGAKVDQFLSKSVTHVIVKSLPSPSKNRPEPKHSRESPKNPFLDNTGVTDLVRKAEALNMKVWTEEKLSGILSKLVPQQLTATDSLHTLLEDEKLHGTRERDLTAPRSDYFYFKPGSKYLLVEDATGRHRTIMTKEYSSVPKDSSTEWPTLFESFLRPSASTVQLNTPVSEIRARAWSLYVEGKPYLGERPPDSHSRRSSFAPLSATPEPSELPPYLHASGNSVVITSNIASTSATGKSPGIFAPGLGAKDRAIAQMSKRIQVLKGNAQAAAASKRQSELQNTKATPVVQARKVFMTQEQVIKMLRQVKAPIREEPPTKEARIRNREKVDAGLKGREQDTAAGYCENCRLRYTDLSVHIASKKHQRFAQDPSNFTSLDELLKILVRPLNPHVFPPDQPLCWDDHGKDADCAKCGTGMPLSQQSAESGDSAEEYDEDMDSAQSQEGEGEGDEDDEQDGDEEDGDEEDGDEMDQDEEEEVDAEEPDSDGGTDQVDSDHD